MSPEKTSPRSSGDGRKDGSKSEATVSVDELRDLIGRLAGHSGPKAEELKEELVAPRAPEPAVPRPPEMKAVPPPEPLAEILGAEPADIRGPDRPVPVVAEVIETMEDKMKEPGPPLNSNAQTAKTEPVWDVEAPTPRTPLTNGAPKQIAPAKNGVNGRGSNGKRGLVNGNGFVNGKGNGLVNGKGLTNGRGLTNGSGLVNGNGLVNGRGLVNGNGLVNGRGSTGGPGEREAFGIVRRRRKHARITVMVALAVAALMVLPALSMMTPVREPPIVIDGSFNDWGGRTAVQDDARDTPSSSIDLRTVRIHRWSSWFAFQLITEGNILKGAPEENKLDSFIILVDADRSAGTGYNLDGIGADWLIEISGMEGLATGVTVSRFDAARSPHDWNAWTLPEAGRASARGNSLEGCVALQLDSDPLVRVYSFDAKTGSDHLDDIISTGPMVHARLQPCAPLRAAEGDDVALARVTIKASQDTSISALRVRLNTTHLQGAPLELALREDDGAGGMTAGDILVASVSGSGEWLELSPPIKPMLGAGVSKSFWISIKAPGAYYTIGADAIQAQVANDAWPVAVELLAPVSGLEAKVTVGNPSGIEIDGAFADWASLSSKAIVSADSENDVTGGAAPDIDITKTAGLLDEPALYMSTSVKGNALSGTVIPFETRRGSPKATTPPVTPEPPSSVPAQAPPPVPRIGSDRTELFISTGAKGGYAPDWLASGAQYLVAIEGRSENIICATLEHFTGSSAEQWKWEQVSTIQAAAGGPSLETAVPRELLAGIGINYSVFARSTDWSRSHEDTAAPAIRPLLQFAIATFDPLEGLPALPERYVTDQPNGYYIVQFNSSINAQKSASVEALGGTVLDYIPTYGMIVRLPSNDAAALRTLPGVRWVGIHQPAFRVDPLLLDKTGELALKVSTYQNEASVSSRIAALGGNAGSVVSSVLTVHANATILSQIANIPDVKFIEPVLTPGFWNDMARSITRVNMTNEVYGLTGKGQIIAIADSGLDTGNDSDNQPNNPDFTGRVLKWYNVTGELLSSSTDYTDDTNGHGTHVAGTAAGGGNASNGKFRGVAPEASIVVQACGDGTSGSGLYIYNDLGDLYGPPFSDGARIHSNSWGYSDSSYFGKYVEACYQTDYFMWNITTMLVVYAAGNDGTSGSGDANTTSPPATSKNVLNVGASESYRPQFNSRGDNIEHIAEFSSRGGTLDGRIKPDIVAPGTWILSSRSSAASGTGWGFFNDKYEWMGGTSQATPHVSGAAILARQYFVECENLTPSAALLKAVLINGADDIGTADIPNMNEGWGRLNLTNSLFPEKPRVMRYVDNTTGFNSSDPPVVLNFTAGHAGVPLKFTLVWTDYPGSSVAAQSSPKLVNDLDLNVTAPNGTRYKGNVFTSGFSTSSGSNDRLNNVECVYFNAPECGTYSVSISPYTITNGSQPFSLVISGELVPDLNVTNVSVDPASPKGGDDVWINATVVNSGSENLPPLFREHFSSLDPKTKENLTDIAFAPGGDFALLVGSNRTVVRYNTSTGAFATLDTTKCPWTDFEGVSFNPKNHAGNRTLPEALLVGTNGTVVDYNGTGFTNVSGFESGDALLDVAWDDLGQKALIVGKGGKVYTFPNVSSAFSDNFESGDGSWTFAGGTKWVNVTDQNVSPDHSMHCTYGKSASGSKYYIYTGEQNLTNDSQRSAYVEFQQMYKTPVDANGDRGELYVRVDKDAAWTWPFVARYLTYTGNTIGWEKQSLDLYGYYPTGKFRLMFQIASTNNAANGDWWIDDVFINRTHYAAASVSTPGNTDMRSVQFIPGTDKAIMVGDDGVVWKFSAGSVSALSNSDSNDLRALAFKPLNNTALLVGDAGTVLRYYGSNDTIQGMSFPDSSISLWDVAFKPGFSREGPKPDSSQALLVGVSGFAWQYFAYDDHFENASTSSSKTLYAVAFNVFSRHPVYGPALIVGHGSDPVVLIDNQTQEFRPFIVDFYSDNSSYSSKWLGRIVKYGGLKPDPYPPYETNVTVSFQWKNVPGGAFNITARVDITNNESASPPVPDRINEVQDWTNNQVSMYLLVPEFNSVLMPIAGMLALFIALKRSKRSGRKIGKGAKKGAPRPR